MYLDAFGDADPDIGPGHCGGGFSIGCVGAQCFFSPLPGFLGPSDVDAGGQLGNVGQDRDVIVCDLHEAAVHGNVLHGSVGHHGSNFAHSEHAHERNVTGLEANLAIGGPHDHQRSFAFEDDLFR